MPFAGWAMRFLTLDFLGAIFFWYFSLRKIFRRKQKFCWIQMCSICCSCSWRPRRLKRKIWRPSQGSLQPYFGLSVCMFVMSLKTLKTFINCIFIWYRNRKITLLPFRVFRIHEETRRQNQVATEDLFDRSSGNFRVLVSGEMLQKNLSDIFCGSFSLFFVYISLQFLRFVCIHIHNIYKQNYHTITR